MIGRPPTRRCGGTLLGIALALVCAGWTTGAPRTDTGVRTGHFVTGLTGTIRRGPITPVCRADVLCYLPLRSSFEVRRGQRLVARFKSDSAGWFRVRLAPGAYTVVPDSNAPIFLRRQSRAVTVGPVGMTQVDLRFDTGIR